MNTQATPDRNAHGQELATPKGVETHWEVVWGDPRFNNDRTIPASESIGKFIQGLVDSGVTEFVGRIVVKPVDDEIRGDVDTDGALIVDDEENASTLGTEGSSRDDNLIVDTVA
jgi:hypothetical protein